MDQDLFLALNLDISIDVVSLGYSSSQELSRVALAAESDSYEIAKGVTTFEYCMRHNFMGYTQTPIFTESQIA